MQWRRNAEEEHRNLEGLDGRERYRSSLVSCTLPRAYAGTEIGDFRLQLRILLRAIAMLKPGGRLVYSTCSLNPVENEAVVSAALEACPGSSTRQFLSTHAHDVQQK